MTDSFPFGFPDGSRIILARELREIPLMAQSEFPGRIARRLYT